MSTLSSLSTLAQKQAAYDDSASYEEDDSVSKARAFITACRLLLRVTPAEADQSGMSRIRIDTVRIKEELDEAKEWLAANDPDSTAAVGGVKFSDMEDFRT